MKLNKKRLSFLNLQTRDVDENALTVTHIVNDKTLDRYDTIVLPRGARVENFLSNPVVLWSHNGDSSTNTIPIGRCVELTVEDDYIRVKTQFNANDPLAIKVFNAYKDGFLNSWSIGFIPEKYEVVTSENLEGLNTKHNISLTEKDIEHGAYVIDQWELLEYSAVPVPGNPGATGDRKDFTKELLTRGLISKEEFENLEKEPKSKEDTKKEIKEDVKTEVKKEVKKEDGIDTRPDLIIKTLDEFYAKSQESYNAVKEALVKVADKISTLEIKITEKEEKSNSEIKEIKDVLAKLANTITSVKKDLEVDNIDSIRGLEEDNININEKSSWVQTLFENAHKS